MGQVFVSYARAKGGDSGGGDGLRRAEQVSAIIALHPDLNPWIDREETRGSQDWRQLIRSEIAQSKLFVIILTPEIELSTYISWELALADAHNVPILPIRFNVELDSVQALPWGPFLLTVDVFDVGAYFSQSKKEKLFELIQVMAGVEPILPYTSPTPPPPSPEGRVTSFVNFKGGVGKTTLTALSGIWLAHSAGKRVLAIDLDPQENLTDVLLRADVARPLAGEGRSALGLFEPFRMPEALRTPPDAQADKHMPAAPYLQLPVPALESRTGPGRLDVLAGDIRLMKFAQVDSQLRGAFVWNFRQAMVALKRHYDHILIDCGPSASLLSIVAFDSADEIIAPARAQQGSTRGLYSMLQAGKAYSMDLAEKVRVVFNMVRDLAGETAYVTGFKEDPGQHISADLAPLKGRAFEAVIPLAATLTDTTMIVDKVLQAGGDLDTLGAARSRVEAFCAELLGPQPVPDEAEESLFGEDWHDMPADVHAGTHEQAGGDEAEDGAEDGPDDAMDVDVDVERMTAARPEPGEDAPRLDAPQANGHGAAHGATGPVPTPAGENGRAVEHGAPRAALDRELDRLTSMQDRLLDRSPAIAEAQRALQPFTLEQKMTLAQRRTGLSRRAFLDRIVEEGVACGLRALEPGQRTLPRTSNWLCESLRPEQAEELIRRVGEASARDR